MHGLEKRIVYILRSESNPQRHYVGLTNNIDASSNGTTTGRAVTLFTTGRGLLS
jgi:hypothetical protein